MKKTNLVPGAEKYVEGYMKNIKTVIKIYAYEFYRVSSDIDRDVKVQEMFERMRELIEERDRCIETFTIKEEGH